MAGGRIRTIKPELLEDEALGNLSLAAKWLFVSCILLSDDHGNLRAAPKYLHGAVFWGNPETDLAGAIAELEAAELVMTYRVKGQHFLHIINFDKHQKIDKPGKPKVPGPDEKDEDSGTFEKIPEDSRKVATRARALDWKGEEEEKEGSAPAGVSSGFSLEAQGAPTKRSRKDWPAPTLPPWLPAEPWEAWLDYRRRGRGTYTTYAQHLTLKALEKLKAEGQDPAAVLEQSIRRSWTDVFPVKGDDRPDRPKSTRLPERDFTKVLRRPEEEDPDA